MKFLVLGAGPSGLTISYLLHKNGHAVTVLEKENEAGGLCRSTVIGGAPIDIGGGHFLDVKRTKVKDFLFQFMPKEEWNIFERDSRISIKGNLIHHPIEANLWELPLQEQVKYLKSIAVAGCNVNPKMPEDFVSWIYWKLGQCIAEDYMLPYNKKMFGDELSRLGTYWLEKLPNVSFEETLLSCLTKKAYGTQPGHAQFYYPKNNGYGEVWLRIAEKLGKTVVYDCNVKKIDFIKREVYTDTGAKYKADVIITTIPWLEFDVFIGMPDDLQKRVRQLKHTSVQIEYIPRFFDTPAHWIYYPEQEIPYHRILLRNNFLFGSQGYWTETNAERVDKMDNSENCFLNQYAYPLNTIDKPVIMDELLKWAKKQHVIGLGRWGEHQHYNSDVAVDLAMKLAEDIITEGNIV